MKRTDIFTFLAILALLALSACSTVRVGKTQTDPRIDFTQYNSFEFVKVDIMNETKLEPQEKNIEKLKNAIRREFGQISMTEDSNADLKINLGILMEEGVTTRETNFQDDAPIYIGQRNYHWESQEVVVDRYEKGTVFVDVVDTKKDILIWEGSASGVIVKNQDKMEKRINEGIEKIFNHYPVQPDK